MCWIMYNQMVTIAKKNLFMLIQGLVNVSGIILLNYDR